MGKLGQTTNTSRTRSAGGDVNSVALRTKILKILKCCGDVAEMVSDFFIRVFIQAVLCDSWICFTLISNLSLIRAGGWAEWRPLTNVTTADVTQAQDPSPISRHNLYLTSSRQKPSSALLCFWTRTSNKPLWTFHNHGEFLVESAS